MKKNYSYKFLLLTIVLFQSIFVLASGTSTLNGVYTIDPNGSGSNNYNSFSGAVSDLTSQGVDGNVVFLVADGVYTDQIEIGSIVGASDTSMIVFRAANDTNVVLQYSATSATDNWVVKLAGAKYIVFKGFKFVALGNSYGRVFLFDGNNEHIMIDSNLIGTKENAINYNHAPFFITNGGSNYNIISHNYINGGSVGIHMQGTSSITNKGNIIYKNQITGFKNQGVYASYTDSIIVDKNAIYYSLGSGSPKGIYLNYVTNASEIAGNHIALDGGNTVYGISVSGSAPSTTRGLIANNFVSCDGGPNTYGIRLASVTNYDIFYNSVNVVGVNSSAALYHSGGGNNVSIYNNIFLNINGNYGFYSGAPSGISSADNNCIYNTGGVLAYWNGNQTSLAGLQTASGKFTNSVSVNPDFNSDVDLHTENLTLNEAAIPLTRVSHDIDGDTRDATNPDIGADEFTPFIPFVEQTNLAITGMKNGDASWADYDNDGDLDVLVSGNSAIAGTLTKLYKNNGNNSFTEQTSILFAGVSYSSIEWADYDNDDDLDLLLTGTTNGNASGAVSKLYKNNGNNTFTEQTSISLTAVYQSSVAWADYDNDGDLDILLTGMSSSSTPIAKLYRNDVSTGSGFNEQTAISLTGVSEGDVAWGDFDNDGLLDILLTGDDGSSEVSKVYKNIPAAAGQSWNFVEQTGIVLSGVKNSAVLWADYDNDADVDIVLTGNNGSRLFKVYRNDNNGIFVEQTNLTGVDVDHASLVMADFDSDGYLDLLVSGETDTGMVVIGFHNDSLASFSQNDDVFIDEIAGAVDVGDYDNDGDLDILLIGEDNSSAPNAKIYKSMILADNPPQSNVAPSAPTNLMSMVVKDSIYFIWSPAADDVTWPLGMSYNIRIGTAANKLDMKAPRSDTLSGYNRIAEMGEITDTFYALKVNDSLIFEKDIYWSVQAVDQGFAASAFSAVDTVFTNDFFINQPVPTVPNLVLGSSSWGDFDNDGILDLLISGIDPATSLVVTKVYKNNIANPSGGLAEQTNISLTGVCKGDVEWIDYDNDGDMDIFITGSINATGSAAVVKLYRNDGSSGTTGFYTFTEQTGIHFDALNRSSSDWGDFDNDGDLDLLISGIPQNGPLATSFIYENNGNNTFKKRDDIYLQGASYGASLWADYDNDGDLDILITGYQSGMGYFTKIYQNENNQDFVEQTSLNLEKLSFSSAAWGDYDNDGDLDLLIAGKNEVGTLYTKVYQNEVELGGVFVDQTSIVLPGIYKGDVAWVDANSDGLLDILISGNPYTGTNDSTLTELYMNSGLSGNYAFIEHFDASLMDMKNSRIAVADIDTDGDLDLLIQGEDILNNAHVNFYENNNLDSNELPSKPIGLVSQIVGDSIRFSWNKSTDIETPSQGLSYNLRIGSTINGIDILAPQSDSSGFRKIVKLGAIRDTTITIKAPLAVSACSKLYWSVQAIDNGFSGSEFSDADSLQNAFSTQTSDMEIARYDTTQISVATNSCLAVTYLWSPSSSLSNANVQSPEAFPLETTVYTVEITHGGITTYDSLTVFVNQFTSQDSIAISELYRGSIIWGDYDNDHDLDFLLTGWSATSSHMIKLYNNNGSNNFDEQLNIGLPAFEHQSVVWGDYDNDGDLDILMSGYQNGGLAKIYRNDGPSAGSGPYTFTEQTAISIAGLFYGDVKWADFDNDGYLDIIISGLVSGYPNYVAETKIYKNNGPSVSTGNFTFTEQTSLSIPGFWYCSIACGDFDNDGKMDFVISGDTAFNQSATMIYKNNISSTSTNWNFVSQNIPLVGVSYGSVDWGDYNNDGNLDLLISGNNSTNIYKNNGDNTFTSLSGYAFINKTSRSSAWGDYDNDGDLDFILSGVDSTKKATTNIYRNDGADVFTRQDGLSIENTEGNVAWADYDNDGDLDFVLSGKSWNNTTSKIYRNNLIKNIAPQPNTPPSAPYNLHAQAVDTTITFSWNASVDANTPKQSLTYNLLVGSSISTIDINAPQADTITGFHRVVALGSIRDTVFTMHIDSIAKLYWSVQAIDQGFEGSAFAPIDSLVLVKEASFTASSNNLTAPPFNVSFTNTSLGYNAWSWSFGDANFSSQKNPTHIYAYNGTYTVTLYVTDTVSNETDTAVQTIVCAGGVNNPCAFSVELTQSQTSAMICQGDSVRLSATPLSNVSYVWTHNGAAIPNSNDSVFYAKDPGFYMVVASTSTCSKLSDNYFVLANYPYNPPVITTIGSIAPCSNDSLQLSVPSGFTSYLWNTGATTSSIYTKLSGYFSVEVIDANSCLLNSEEAVINTSLAKIPNICVVGVASSTNHNVVEWLAENTTKIDSFRVYKETTISNQYDYIGSVVYTLSPSFEDVNSNVAVRQYQYRISAIDTCGKESPFSLAHKTMHLQVNAAINDHWNLIWQPYKGFTFGSYRIYRGTDSLNMNLLTTVSSNVTAYTDLNNPTGDIYYQIEIESTNACQAKSYATSRSNLFNTKNASGVGINTQNAMVFNAMVYPNPSNGLFTLKIMSAQENKMHLEVFSSLGDLVYSEQIFANNHYQHNIDLRALSKGVYALRLLGKLGVVYYAKLIIR